MLGSTELQLTFPLSSSVVISTAIAAWIYEKKPDNLELLINILNGTFKLVIHAPGVPPSHLLKEGSIDLKWLDKALQIAGIDKHEESTGVATQQELNEFAQLDAWKMSE